MKLILIFIVPLFCVNSCKSQYDFTVNNEFIIIDTIQYSHSKYNSINNGKGIDIYTVSHEDYNRFNNAKKLDVKEKYDEFRLILSKYKPHSIEFIPDLFTSGKFHDPYSLFSVLLKDEEYKFEFPTKVYSIPRNFLVFPFRLKELIPNAARMFHDVNIDVKLLDSKDELIETIEGKLFLNIFQRSKLNLDDVNSIIFQVYNDFDDVLEIRFNLEEN